ncbi:MAG: hypothetical protein KDD99_29280 [Bacteroidetes bacterium]|nr:hypothetical protein [Bacteroidota bacterium]
MKTITIINWIMIAIWLIVAAFMYFDTKNSSMDAAGRGMAQGFLMIGFGFIILLALLNLINVKWVRILVLLMGTLPVAYQLIRAIRTQIAISRHEQQIENANFFEDERLNEIARAIRTLNLATIETILEKDGETLSENYPNEMVSLLDMVVSKAPHDSSAAVGEIIALLLAKGADPDFKRPNTPPTLYNYVLEIPVEILETLLKGGADPNTRDHNGVPVLYKLVDTYYVKDEYPKVKLLLEHGADPNLPLGEEGYLFNWSALTSAAVRKSWKVCELLIEHGADMGFTPENGRTFAEIITTARKEYQDGGETSEDYQALMANEKVVVFMENLH